MFVAHLMAAFRQHGVGSQLKRCRELADIVRILGPQQGTNHLLMGDFNSIAPGDRAKGSRFLRDMADPDLYYHLASGGTRGLPSLNYVVPPSLRFVTPLLVGRLPKTRRSAPCLMPLTPCMRRGAD